MSLSSVTTSLSSNSIESNNNNNNNKIRLSHQQKSCHYCIYCNQFCSIDNHCNCDQCILPETNKIDIKKENNNKKMIRLETKRLNIIKSSFDNEFKFKPINENEDQRNHPKVIFFLYNKI